MFSYMVVGGQWGSEGKGLFAGFLAKERLPDAVVCQFGPNAGHTWIHGDTPIVFKSLPVGSIAPSVKRIFIGPGAVVDPSALRREIEMLGPLLNGKEIYVHEAVAILYPTDKHEESGKGGVAHIASTMQGTSIAMIRKIQRSHELKAYRMLADVSVRVVNHNTYSELIHIPTVLQIEGSQGMDLSINSGVTYPYVTSRDCTPAQVMADCGLHPYDLTSIVACIRTYPIRVGNIIVDGVTIGTSGPCYPDQHEMTWEEVGQKEEYTTVTKRVRRVFSFSMQQIQKLLTEVRPNHIMLNFANYLPEDKLACMMSGINKMAGRNIIRWTGHGPRWQNIKTHTTTKPINPPVYQE